MDDPNQTSASKTCDYVTISIKTENSIVVKTEDSMTTITVKSPVEESQAEDQTPSVQEVTKMQCIICDQVFGRIARAPMILSCGHLCCRRCLLKIKTSENFFKCAVCRSLNVGSIQNFTLIDYLEEIAVLATDDEMTEEDRVEIPTSAHQPSHDTVDYDSEDERLSNLYGVPINVELTAGFLREHRLLDAGRRWFCELCQCFIGRSPREVAQHVNGTKHGKIEVRIREAVWERRRLERLAASQEARRRAQLLENENEIQNAIQASVRDAQITNEVQSVQDVQNVIQASIQETTNQVQYIQNTISINEIQFTQNIPSTNEVKPVQKTPSINEVQSIEEIPDTSQRGGKSLRGGRFAQRADIRMNSNEASTGEQSSSSWPIRAIMNRKGRGNAEIPCFWTGRNFVSWTKSGWFGSYDNNEDNMPKNWRMMTPTELSAFFEQETHSNTQEFAPKDNVQKEETVPNDNVQKDELIPKEPFDNGGFESNLFSRSENDFESNSQSQSLNDIIQSNVSPMTISDYEQWRAPFPEHKKAGDGLEFFCFFGKRYAFDNYFMASFVINGQKYDCVQQYLQTFQQENRTQGKEKIVATALEAKFRQNEFCLSMLIQTGQLTIVEASRNTYWGIGCDMYNADQIPTTKWSGRNRFGKLLMDLRQKLQEAHSANPNSSIISSQTPSAQAENGHDHVVSTHNDANSAPSQNSGSQSDEQKPSSTSDQKPEKLKSEKTTSPEEPKKKKTQKTANAEEHPKKSKKPISKSSISTQTDNEESKHSVEQTDNEESKHSVEQTDNEETKHSVEQTDNEETKHSVERTSEEVTNIEETVSLEECLEELEKENERKLETISKMREELKEIPIITLTE